MPSIRFYSTTELPSSLMWQVRSFMRTRWTFLFGQSERLRPGLWWIETLSPVHAVLAEGDVLISYSAIVRKQLEHLGERYTALGLNGVFTYPDFRREGYGKQLVEAATKHIANESGADVGVLFCRSDLIPFYSTAGWSHESQAATLVGKPENPQHVETEQATSERRMMVFVSKKAKQARQLFWEHPLCFGESEW
jgi:GNAT superfamily N-acetyltransferase